MITHTCHCIHILGGILSDFCPQKEKEPPEKCSGSFSPLSPRPAGRPEFWADRNPTLMLYWLHNPQSSRLDQRQWLPKMLFIGVFSSFPLVFQDHQTRHRKNGERGYGQKDQTGPQQGIKAAGLLHPAGRKAGRSSGFSGFPLERDWKGSSPAPAKDEKQRQGALRPKPAAQPGDPQKARPPPGTARNIRQPARSTRRRWNSDNRPPANWRTGR